MNKSVLIWIGIAGFVVGIAISSVRHTPADISWTLWPFGEGDNLKAAAPATPQKKMPTKAPVKSIPAVTKSARDLCITTCKQELSVALGNCNDADLPKKVLSFCLTAAKEDYSGCTTSCPKK